MLERDRFARDAENFRYGFLSAALEPVLSRTVGSPLTDEEIRQLELARSFLSDVVDGARLVSKGEASSVSARRAVDALGYALGPLEAMKQLQLDSEEQVLIVLRAMLDCIKQSISQRRLEGAEMPLAWTAQLFKLLDASGLSSVKRRTPAATRNPTIALQ